MKTFDSKEKTGERSTKQVCPLSIEINHVVWSYAMADRRIYDLLLATSQPCILNSISIARYYILHNLCYNDFVAITFNWRCRKVSKGDQVGN